MNRPLLRWSRVRAVIAVAVGVRTSAVGPSRRDEDRPRASPAAQDATCRAGPRREGAPSRWNALAAAERSVRSGVLVRCGTGRLGLAQPVQQGAEQFGQGATF